MKKLFALLLALVLALGTTSAMALELDKGFQADVTLNVNKDALDQLLNMSGAYNSSSAPSPELVNSVVDLISMLGMTLKTDGSNALFGVNLNGQSIVSAQIDNTFDGGLALTTNLLPSYAFVVDGQTMNMLKTQMSSMITANPQQIEQATAELLANLEKAIREEYNSTKCTVLSSGNTSYSYKGVNFDYVQVRTVKPVDLMEAAQRLAIRAIDLVDNYAKQIGLNVPQLNEELQKARQDLANTDVRNSSYNEDLEIKVTEYRAKDSAGYYNDNYVYMAIEMKDNYTMVYLTLAVLDGNADLTMLVGNGSYTSPKPLLLDAQSGRNGAMAIEMNLVQGATNEDVEVNVSVTQSGMTMRVLSQCKPDGMGGMNEKAELYVFNDAQPLMTINYAIKPMNGVLPAVNLNGRQQLNILELASGNGMDYELQQALTTELQNSATSLLINVITAAPQQVQTLMNEVTNMMNNQQNNYDDYDYYY